MNFMQNTARDATVLVAHAVPVVAAAGIGQRLAVSGLKAELAMIASRRRWVAVTTVRSVAPRRWRRGRFPAARG